MVSGVCLCYIVSPYAIIYKSLYYKQQKQTETEKVCGNCNEIGHIRRECQNEVVCYECHQPGHKKGSPECQGFVEADHETMDDNKSDKSDDSDGGESDDKSVNGGEDDGSGEEGTENSENMGEKVADEAETINEANEKKQIKISDFWAAKARAIPKTTRSASPARVRRLEDLSPSEIDKREHKKMKETKHGKVKNKK